MPSTRPLFQQIDDWLTEIDSVKTAASKSKPKKAVKKAAPDGVGETSHPSEDVDNDTQEAETGARYEENSTDVKKDVSGMAVDETDKGSGGDQDDKQFNIGTQQAATGEDPSVEDDYKGTKEDGTTDHPADAEDTGEKYSSMKLNKLLKMAEDRAHSILADLANGITTPTQATNKYAHAPVQPQTVQTVANDGYNVAYDLEKSAADFVAQTIKDADVDADLVGAFVHSYYSTKQAEGEEGPPQEEPPSEGAGGEQMPPEMAGGMGGGSPAGGGDVLSALGAGGGGGGMPPEAAGGMPPAGDDASGGAASAGGDAGGGGMKEEQALQELVMALQELGISPDELAQMAQGASAPPGASGEGQKLGSAAKKYKLSGRFRMEEAKTAAQKQARDQIKDYIREIAGLKN